MAEKAFRLFRSGVLKFQNWRIRETQKKSKEIAAIRFGVGGVEAFCTRGIRRFINTGFLLAFIDRLGGTWEAEAKYGEIFQKHIIVYGTPVCENYKTENAIFLNEWAKSRVISTIMARIQQKGFYFPKDEYRNSRSASFCVKLLQKLNRINVSEGMLHPRISYHQKYP